MPDGPFAVDRSERIFSGFLVDVDRLRLSGQGSSFDREIVRHPGAVAVVPLHEDGSVTLVRQFRASVGERILEITAGTCDVLGEDLATTARRELVEEVGLAAGRLEQLGSFLNSPGYCDQRTVVFLATDLTEVDRQPEGPEETDAEVVRIALDHAISMVVAGDIADGTTAFGLLMAARHRGR